MEYSPKYIKNEILAGLTTSFAMVPETVAFAFVAGVNPLMGLYTSFTSGLATALWGGRPGMISGGAGSLAVVSAALVASHGVEYLLAAVALMGVIQAIVGAMRWGRFIDLVPHPVMLGFVNGLAIVIFLSQLRQIPFASGGSPLWIMLGLVALTVAITALLPRVTKALPSALVAIAVTTTIAILLHLTTKRVGDLAAIKAGFPLLHFPNVPLTWETAQIVVPFAFLLAGVGLTESLLTQQVVDEITETPSSRNRECIGQGIGNIVTGLFGGMGGCAMIGQTVINLESGGRGQLSGIVEALSVLAFVVVASHLIGMIPMAALVGVMFVVVYKTFAWSSLRILNKIPRTDAVVLILVSAITVWRDLATAVLAGVIVSALAFAWENALRLRAVRSVALVENGDTAIYELHGPLFFGAIQRFHALFTPKDDPANVVIDFAHSRLYGHSALEALDALTKRYAALGKRLALRGLNAESLALIEKAGGIVTVMIVNEITP